VHCRWFAAWMLQSMPCFFHLHNPFSVMEQVWILHFPASVRLYHHKSHHGHNLCWFPPDGFCCCTLMSNYNGTKQVMDGCSRDWWLSNGQNWLHRFFTQATTYHQQHPWLHKMRGIASANNAKTPKPHTFGTKWCRRTT